LPLTFGLFPKRFCGFPLTFTLQKDWGK